MLFLLTHANDNERHALYDHDAVAILRAPNSFGELGRSLLARLPSSFIHSNERSSVASSLTLIDGGMHYDR